MAKTIWFIAVDGGASLAGCEAAASMYASPMTRLVAPLLIVLGLLIVGATLFWAATAYMLLGLDEGPARALSRPGAVTPFLLALIPLGAGLLLVVVGARRLRR
jgi:hypothetical protein